MSAPRRTLTSYAFSLAQLLSEYSRCISLSLLVLLAPASAMAQALQPLGAFLASARQHNLDNRDAEATLAQRSAEATQARYRLLPTVGATAGYTFNQFEASVPVQMGATLRTLTITPQNQLEAVLSVSVPLIDVGGWLRLSAAEATTQGAQLRQAAMALSVERRVAQGYYQLVANEALVQSAARALEVSRSNLDYVTRRAQAGLVTALEQQRASAEVARNRQTLAEAELQRALSAHALGSLTGLSPSGNAGPLVPSTEPPAPLDALRARLAQLPAVRASAYERLAAERTERAGWTALAPTVNATAQERFTNATGFAGQAAYFSAGVSLTWRADLSSIPAARALAAGSDGARLREERARLTAEDELFEAWQRVRSALVRSESSRAQEQVSAQAYALSRERFEHGTSTQLEVLQAGRDAFTAELSRIQADADLALARAVLRTAVGQPADLAEGGAR